MVAALLLGWFEDLPPLSQMQTEWSLLVRAGRDRWTFATVKPKDKFGEKLGFDRYEVVRKNGRVMRRFVLETGPFLDAVLVRIYPGYPVIAVRAAYGLGVHWDTMLFAIRKGKLIEMGRPPAMNSNGPVLWNGRKDVWMFDNYDRYERAELKPALVLMKVDRNGRLEPWREIKGKHQQIPTTIWTPRLY